MEDPVDNFLDVLPMSCSALVWNKRNSVFPDTVANQLIVLDKYGMSFLNALSNQAWDQGMTTQQEDWKATCN